MICHMNMPPMQLLLYCRCQFKRVGSKQRAHTMHLPTAFFVLCSLWLATSQSKLLQLRLVSFLPLGYEYFDTMYSAAAVNLTVDKLNREWRHSLRIEIDWLANRSSSICNDAVADALHMVPRHYYRREWQGCMALIGENCSGIVEIASLATEWNVPLFEILPNQQLADKQASYPTTLVPPEGYDGLLEGLVQLLHIRNWRRGCLIIDRDLALHAAGYFWELGRTFTNRDAWLRQRKITIERKYIDGNNGSIDYGNVLQPCFGSVYSFILILASTPRTVEILRAASALGMGDGNTAFWPLVPSGSPLHNKTELALNILNLTDLTLRSVVHLTWIRSSAWFSADNDSAMLKRLAQNAFSNPPSPQLQPEELLSVWNTKHAINSWVQAALAAWQRGLDPCDGRLITRQIRKTLNAQADDASAVEDDDAQPDAGNMRLQVWNATARKFSVFLEYNSSSKRIVWTTFDMDEWPVPFQRDSEGPCGYSANAPYCKLFPFMPAEMGAIGLIVLLLIPLIIAFVNRRMRVQRENNQEWIIAPEQLDLPTDAKHPAAHETQWHGTPVWAIPVPLTKHSQPDRLRRDNFLGKLYLVKHDNVISFCGLYFAPKCIWIISALAKRGPLGVLLQTMDTDWEFRLSFIVDLMQGLHYIHGSPIKSHGNLTLATCLLDHRFVCKVGCLGFEHIKMALKDSKYSLPNLEHKQHASASRYSALLASLWSADIAAFQAVVMGLSRMGWRHVQLEARQHFALQSRLEGFADNVGTSENMGQVESHFKAAFPGQQKSPVDSLIDRLAGYTEVLEHAVAIRTTELLSEQEHCDRLLEQMLPRPVVVALRSKHTVEAELFECASICFTSLPGFVPWVATVSAATVIDFLQVVYTLFDEEIAKFDVHKIESIADGYVVASGIPVRNGLAHVPISCRMAQRLMLLQFPPQQTKLTLRVGVHSGSCAAGVIGTLVPRYCLFGDAVNTSSRMESHGESGKIHASADTVRLLAEEDASDIVCILRGQIPIKGKGFMTTYWIL